MTSRLSTLREQADLQTNCLWHAEGDWPVTCDSAAFAPIHHDSSMRYAHDYQPGPPTDLQRLVAIAEATESFVIRWGPKLLPRVLEPLLEALAAVEAP